MDIVNLSLFAFLDGSSLLNILIAAAGLGMVIFFHELGHFLVAKWCDVYVERFSIGFGQPILSKKWGETEYWLSWIPFGGYVKMLGQDDMDPGQMTDEMVAEDPRSYSAKTVPQRMAIISAGVIMNIITGFIFFAIAFKSGVETTDHVVGHVEVGMPGWVEGLRTGDEISTINNRPVTNFEDILRGTALSQGPIRLTGSRVDGETFDITLEPASKGIVRQIGLRSILSTRIADVPDTGEYSFKLPGTSAAESEFLRRDQIKQVNGQSVEDFVELQNVLISNADKPLQVVVAREQDGQAAEKTLTLAPMNFVGFGMKFWIGKIEAIRKGSPAAEAGLKIGDQIAKVNDLSVENDLDPFRLTEFFSEHAGEEVVLTVSRHVEGDSPQEVEIKLTPEDRGAWTEPPLNPGSMLSIPSIGVAYHLIPSVHSVEEGSIAAEKGIQKRDQLTKVILKKQADAQADQLAEDNFELEIGEKNAAFVLWVIQQAARSRAMTFEFKRGEDIEPLTVEMQPQPIEDWYLPTARGLVLGAEMTTQSADSIGEAFAMAGRYTVTSMEDIYLTLRGLILGSISHKGLSGPVNIAKMAYGFADLGIGHFLRFLGLISVNLAVINFLPIPVLDGGHMVFLMWEGLFRRKPPEKVVNFAHLVGFVLILSMMGFVLYQDIFVSKI